MQRFMEFRLRQSAGLTSNRSSFRAFDSRSVLLLGESFKSARLPRRGPEGAYAGPETVEGNDPMGEVLHNSCAS